MMSSITTQSNNLIEERTAIMLPDMVYHQEKLTIVAASSPPGAKEMEFYGSELFSEEHQNNSEVASSSNGGNEEEYSSYPINISYTSKMNLNKETFDPITFNTIISSVSNMNNNNNKITENISLIHDSPGEIEEGIIIASNNIENNNQNNNNNKDSDNVSLVFSSPGEIENDIVLTSIDFNQSTNYSTPQLLNNQQDQQFDFSSLSNQLYHGAQDIITNNSINHQYNNNPSPTVTPLTISSSVLPHSFEDESLATVSSNYTQMNPTIHSRSLINSGIGAYMPTPLPFGDFSFQVDNNLGNNSPYTVPLVFDFNDDIQGLANETQHLMKEHSSSTPLISERVSSFDESSALKVGKLSVEERKEKINKYIKKRNERNFTKKIKYACRKTLADKRPRVRGRFAKHDDLIEVAMTMMNHEEDTDSRQVVLRDEDFVLSSDIFAQLDGVNTYTFSCNNLLNPIHSWT